MSYSIHQERIVSKSLRANFVAYFWMNFKYIKYFYNFIEKLLKTLGYLLMTKLAYICFCYAFYILFIRMEFIVFWFGFFYI